MVFLFDEFELDTDALELRRNGQDVPLEPQVYAVLLLLVENRDRLVSKDEIVEKVWDGRFITDSALTSRIKALRAALGDDGKSQRYIKTLHRQGYRFVGRAKIHAEAAAQAANEAPPAQDTVLHDKPSLAVLPFRFVGTEDSYLGFAEALPAELISELARLRWIFVIARGTAFRFRPEDQDVVAIGSSLRVRYALTGSVEVYGTGITVAVELSETASGGVIWGERYSGKIDDIHAVRERIVAEVVAALELRIPQNEAQAARLSAPDGLDAWSAYHLGLQHLYRFNKRDNEMAQGLFETAVTRAPDFARAHAALSGAHFQNVFMHYAPDRQASLDLTRAHAERAHDIDPLDPFTNFAMGRVHWVEEDIATATLWLDRSVSLSPNDARAIYARAWTNAITGAAPFDGDINMALSLSPLDPFRFAMLSVRGFHHLAQDDCAEAARWTERAARSPGAHILIAALATVMHSLAGNRDQARSWAENVRQRDPGFSQATFLSAFPFQDPQTRAQMLKALTDQGF